MNDDPLIGKTLDGRYRVSRVIGGGGMGAVYEALHEGTGRRLAIKVISTGDITKNEALVGRFQREAKAAGSIDTQHIAQVLDTGRDSESGLPFMAMELLNGEDLQQFFRRVGPIPPELALRIAAQACIGLQKAHEARVVHRDIKPANLFLAQRDEGQVIVKVLDFGIAKIKMDQANTTDTDGLTRTGSMLGSPLYMSPEQARGHKTIDHRADIWSLGVVLYQALTGRTPHHEIEALGELIITICASPPRPVQDFAPWVPGEVAAVVHGALRLAPEERFQTASAMLDAIKALLPNGWNLTQDMLIGVSEEERAQVAPRLSLPGPGEPHALGQSRPSLSPAAASTGEHAGTNDGVARSQRISTARSGAKLPIALGAVAALGVAAFVGMRLFAAPEAVLPDESKTAALIAPAFPAPAAAPAPVVTPAAPQRTVKLVILPDDATVEIDGVAATASDGIVEIVGALGSVHKVRLSVGGAEIKREVVVTETGALPAKVELDVPKTTHTQPVVARPASGGKSAVAAPSPAPAPAPKAPAKGTGIDRSFD